MSTGTYSLAQLAELFQTNERKMRKLFMTLEAQHDFPPRLPVLHNLWSCVAVDEWVAASGRPRDYQPVDTTDPVAIALGPH